MPILVATESNMLSPGTLSGSRLIHPCGRDCLLQNNDLQMIVRAHECVMDGFERFAQGHLITLFSATNYCGTANNAGAILVLGRNLVLVPKLIHPLPPTTPRSSESTREEDRQQPTDTWMQVSSSNSGG